MVQLQLLSRSTGDCAFHGHRLRERCGPWWTSLSARYPRVCFRDLMQPAEALACVRDLFLKSPATD
jgi:hypothetical protein